MTQNNAKSFQSISSPKGNDVGNQERGFNEIPEKERRIVRVLSSIGEILIYDYQHS